MRYFLKIIRLSGIILSCALIYGCTPTQINESFSEWFRLEHLKPVAARHQIFSNTPTAKINPKQQYLRQDLRKEAIEEGYGKARGYYASQEPQNEYNDDSYGAGFEAGCDNFVSVVGTGTMRLIKPKFDANRLSYDEWYLRGYQDASSFCTFNLDWELH